MSNYRPLYILQAGVRSNTERLHCGGQGKRRRGETDGGGKGAPFYSLLIRREEETFGNGGLETQKQFRLYFFWQIAGSRFMLVHEVCVFG